MSVQLPSSIPSEFKHSSLHHWLDLSSPSKGREILTVHMTLTLFSKRTSLLWLLGVLVNYQTYPYNTSCLKNMAFIAIMSMILYPSLKMRSKKMIQLAALENGKVQFNICSLSQVSYQSQWLWSY